MAIGKEDSLILFVVEIHKDTETKDDSEKEEQEEEPAGPAVDENGRLLFRAKTKKKTTMGSTKRSLEDAIEDHRKEKGMKKTKKSKKQKPMTLSFDPDE
jgi:hypothetical protein